MNAADPAAIGAEIERLIARLNDSTASDSASEARRLVQLVLSFHGTGLTRMLDIVGTEGNGRDALLVQFANDPLVASLLALHDIHPVSHGTGLLQITRPSASHRRDKESTREDRCELCAAALPGEHAHLLNIESRRLLCACRVCSSVGGKYRVVPSRFVHLPSMTLAPHDWDALGIPVGLAFFVADSHQGRTIACYPGPAGATESLLPLDAWPALVARYTWLQDVAPDVEALLVRRAGDEYRSYIVPIDACYELIGRIRKAWTGFGGGNVVEAQIDQFFAAVLRKAGLHTEGPA